MISARDFQRECEGRIGGSLFSSSWNSDYQEAVTFTIQEMREIVNTLRKCEGSEPLHVVEENP